MFKRILITALALMMLMMSVSASAASTPDDEKYAILNGKTISWLTSQAKFMEVYNDMAAAIEADFGCKIEFQVVPDNEFYSMLKVKLSTSEVSDVFEYNFPSQNLEIDAAQYCEVLDDEPWMDRLIDPNFIKDAIDGKVYAQPREVAGSPVPVYYNKAILAQAGYTEQLEPKTYQEFLDILDAIKANCPDVIPYYMTNADAWTTQIFTTYGVPVAMGADNEERLAKLLKNELTWPEIPEAIAVMQAYMDLIAGGYVNEDHLSVGYDTAPEVMGTGKAAMYFTLDQWAADLHKNYPDCELGSFTIPFNDNLVMGTGAFVQGLFVPKAGSQVDVAKVFVDLWSQPKYQNIYYESLPGFPAYKDVEGGDVLPATRYVVDNYIAKGDYVIQYNDQLGFISTLLPTLWSYQIEACAGTKTATEVFEAFQKDFADYMQQQGVEGF